MYLIAPLGSRNDLAHLLNAKGLLGQAVEIGTHRGAYAGQLLERWQGQTLWCVDPWGIPPGCESQMKFYDPGGRTREDDYKEVQRLARKHPRLRPLRAVSAVAVETFTDGTLDFVFVDGDHRRQAVADDLRLWWPKLRPGGILAGHDIVMLGPWDREDNWGRNVQPAVEEFSIPLGLPVYLIAEGEVWSFYMEKPR